MLHNPANPHMKGPLFCQYSSNLEKKKKKKNPVTVPTLVIFPLCPLSCLWYLWTCFGMAFCGLSADLSLDEAIPLAEITIPSIPIIHLWFSSKPTCSLLKGTKVSLPLKEIKHPITFLLQCLLAGLFAFSLPSLLPLHNRNNNIRLK